ncbi:MAG: PspC domain-containing protein [Clostridia bacterium]|nr:PspC domain-containing protein [Clostridia bacterium]
MERRLYRSSHDKIIAGVCGGIAEYFRIDPTILRVITIIVSLPSMGLGLMVYIAALILIPKSNGPSYHYQKKESFSFAEKESVEEDSRWDKDAWKDTGFNEPAKSDNGKARLVGGVILISAGVLFLLKQMFSWFDFQIIGPVLLVVIGISILLAGRRST